MSKTASRAPAALAACAALIPFLPALRAGFLDWDDKATVLSDGGYGFSPAGLRWILQARHYGPWQPLSWLSYAADRALWGLDAPSFRRTNLLLHALAAGLLALVARRLLDAALPRADARARSLGALAAALFFALHPLRVESVVWITERRDVLSGALLLGAWLARLEGGVLLPLGLFALALASKGTAVALPFFLLAGEVFPLRRLPADPRRWREPGARAVLSGLAPYFALAAAGGAMNLVGLSTGDLRAPDLSPLARLAVAGHAAGFYLWKTFVPFGLSPYYPLTRNWAAAAPYLAAGAALAAAVTAAAWRARGRAPWALTAWLAYLAALAPVSGLLQNGAQLAADRYSYLACLPFALVVGGAAAASASRRPRAALAAVLAGAAALGALTWRQSGFWRGDLPLWTRAVALAPEAYLPRANLASALLAAGDEDGALAQYPEVLRLEPRGMPDVGARVNLGTLLESRGRTVEAERWYREALTLSPEDAPARFNLGLLLLRSGRKAEGLASLREAVRLDPSLAGRLRR